ncbi:VOC family protein [Streptococcus castoreus]|uniref:VOC family protein n=1 Tax=Streptococcus castoreus TaxID=254786 RepID=UPI00040D2DC0|nr:VOC family protein [Streptococcus castoreus]
MLHHIEIYVSNLAKSRTFYHFLLPKLGYHLYQDWAQGFSFKKAEQYLVFVQVKDEYADQVYHRCHSGLNHLAFYGGSRKDVQALKDQLVNQAVPMLYEDTYPYAGGSTHFAFYCEDPDRIKIEIIAEENND